MAQQDIANIVAGIKNRQLKTQVGAQKQKVTVQGGKVKKGGPSILSRVFDTIQRPLYGVSEGIARASEAKSLGEIGKGIAGGLAGKSKTDIGDALLRSAEHNKGSLLSGAIRHNRGNIRAIAGLAGDIVLDPLTWTGGGIVKAGGKAAADVAKLGAIKDVVNSAKSIKAVEEAANVAKAAKEVSVASRAAEGQKVAKNLPKVLKDVGKAAKKAELRKIWTEAENTVGKAASDAAKTSAPGKVQLKFAGKVVGESEKLYKGTANLGRIVGDTRVGGKLNEAFRTGAKFPELTNKIRREVQLAGIAHAQKEMHAVLFGSKGVEGAKDFAGFHKLTDHELEMVSHAVEAGPVKHVTSLTPEGVPVEEIVKPSSLHGVPGKNVEDLGEYVDKMKEITATHFEDEFSAGVFRHKDGKLKTREEAWRDDYVPHYYKNAASEEDAIIHANKAIGPDNPGFNKVRKIESLKDALSKGLDPHVKADEILVKRIATSHKAIARAKYADAVAQEYGQELGSNAAKNLAKKSGYSTVDSSYISKTMLFPPHIAESFKVLDKMHSDDALYRSFLKTFDTAQNKLKFWQTAANPGHHVRNAVGDIWQNFALGGVKNPHRYDQSLHVLTKPETFKMRAGKAMIDGKTLTEQWIERGAKPGFTLGELEMGEKGVFKGIKGKIAVGSEKREEFTRMANFIEQFKKFGKDLDPASKTFTKDLDEVGSKAAAEVRRVNIDYGDVTDFERNVMKRVMPFYCVPVDHRILTQQGWKTYDQLIIGELVMVFNPYNHSMYWEPLQEVCIFDYDDMLNTIKVKGSIKFQFTPNHRFPVVSSYSKNTGIKEWHNCYSVDKFPLWGNFQKEGSILSPRLAAILGWVVTDGYSRWRGNHWEAMVYQSPSKFLGEVTNLLKPLSVSIHPDSGVFKYTLRLEDSKAISKVYHDKTDLPSLVTQLSREAAEAMYQAMFMAEGHSEPSFEHFAQNPGPVLEAFQILCTMTERVAWRSNRGCYIRGNKYIKWYNCKGPKTHYTGKIWCPRTITGTWIMMGPDGAIMPTGNTWSRKNIPLQIEALALHPGRVATIPKGTAAIQRMMGTDVGYNQNDPLETIPKYLREMAGVRLRGEGEGKNAIYWVPSLPFQDISKYTEGGEQGILQSILSQVTPVIRVPFEKATGKQVFSGANTGSNTQMGASQIPILNQIYNIAKGKQKIKSLKTFNYATGAGAYEINQGQVAGELRRQQDPLQKSIRDIRAKAKKKAMGG